MNRITIAGVRLALGLLAFSSFSAFSNLRAQPQWVTLPNGRQFNIEKNASLLYSYSVKNGKLESMRAEDSRELVKIIVTLKDIPLARYMGKRGLKRTSLASFQSKLQAVHSSVRSKIAAIAQRLTANTNFRYQYTVNREYYTALNGIALECNRRMIGYIRSLPEVKKVQYDEEVKADLTESVHQIRADIVQDSLGYMGDSVLVGEIDTGIDYENPALGGGYGAGFRVIGGHDFSNNDNDPMDDNGHGTHVAGIIGADGSGGLRGVAPHVKFLAVKVLNEDGGGLTSDVIAGIEYCMDPDGNPSTDDAAEVMNMSLGGQAMTDSPLDDAVDNAAQAGVLSVVAAGNSGEAGPAYVDPFGGYTSIGSPGTAASALTVGACDLAYAMAPFSSKGPDRVHFAIKPEVVAPGVGILSTILHDATASWSGTSMATPHAAGVAALLKQEHRNWPPEQLKSAIVNSARALKNSYNPCVQGNGCIDALNAAALGLSVDPGVISFGVVDLTADVWRDTVEFTVRNLRDASQNMNLGVGAELPAGVELNLGQTDFTLAPMQETTVAANIVVPKTVSILDHAPYAYAGNIVCRSDSDTVQVPFAFSKVNTLVIECDREAWDLTLYDGYSSSISIPNLYGVDHKYVVPMYGGTFNLFAMLHASDEVRSRDTFYLIMRKNVSTRGYNHISLYHTEAAFSAFNDLDKVRDMRGDLVYGLDTCGVNLDVLITPTPSWYLGFSFLFYTPRLGQWYFAPMDSSLSVTVSQQIFSLQKDQALLLKTMSAGVKCQDDLTLLSGPENLADLNFKLNYNASPITRPFVQTEAARYFPGFGRSFIYNIGYPMTQLREIHLMSNRSPGVFDPMNYCSMSAGICALGDRGPTWELCTSEFIIDKKGNLVFFDRRPFRPDESECAHIQTLPSGDTVTVEEAAPTPIVQVPKFQFSYPNDRSELSVMEYTPDAFDDGGVIRSDGIHARIFKNYSTNTQQFNAQMFTKNSVLQGGSSFDASTSLYYVCNANRYTDRYRFLAETDRFKLLGQFGVSTADYEFNIRPVPHQDCILPSLDFFQVLGDSVPAQWLRTGQEGKVHLVVCDPKRNVDSVDIYLLENDGTEIMLETTHPSAREYLAPIPQEIAYGFHDVVARIRDVEGNKFELIVSPAFYYGQNEDSIQYDARVRLCSYALDNPGSIRFNAGDTLRGTLTYKNYGNRTVRNVKIHLPRTDYFTPVGDSTITIDSIVAGTYRGQGPRTVSINLVFLGKKQPGDLRAYYTPTVTWNSEGRSFSRKHSVLLDFSTASTGMTAFENEIPREYSLSQNYPNPFNPTTIIRYQLPTPGQASIKVYDLLGREVAALVNEVKRAGRYSVAWNAQHMASGVYFCRLQAGSYHDVKKLLLLK